MIDTKKNECDLVNPGTGLVTGAKQQLAEVKKTALRDLQNDIRMVSGQNLASRGLTADGPKAAGTKRSTPDYAMVPPCRQSPMNGTNANLVYMRRKSEQEVGKSNTIDNVDNTSGCPQLKQFSHGLQEASRQQTPMQGPKGYSAVAPIPGIPIDTYSVGGPSLPLSLGKPANALPLTDVNHTAVITSGTAPLNSQKKSDQNFKERFLRLQAFLKSYENSSHEEYTRMLRALPSVGRSRHAVELEKRAIHLLLEEKKELERMKVLNVLGKSTPKDNASPLTGQAHTPSGK